ncbi:MAG: C25 family cysteine peptidase [Candidatus Delongbacteria bacterium]|jgi:hypothetical protein|nr:C25 family cysteine peptidase [Candidatus Delongbacteria bacterium]
MRKLTVVVLVIVLSLFGTTSPILDASKTTGYKIQADTDSYLDIEFDVKDINVKDVSTVKGAFTRVTIDNGFTTRTAGTPALPEFHELITIPYGATPEVEVISYESKIYKLSELGIVNPIIPAQPSYSKKTPEEDLKFIYNKDAYKVSKMTGEEIASISKSGTMRGVGVGVLKVRPFKYNPTAGTIEVLNDVKVRVNYVNADPRATEIAREEYSPYFESALETLINYESLNTKADLLTYPITYLIVAGQALNGNSDLNDLIAWKTSKGFNVIVNYVPTTASIETNDVWVETQYNTLNPKPSFLLIVGDADGTFAVQAELDPPLGDGGAVCGSDLIYGVIGTTGTTNRIASMYVGRMTVRIASDLTAQVDKTLWYERDQFLVSTPDLNYLTAPMGTAGYDTGYGEDFGNPQIYYGWTYYFTAANGMPNATTHYYPDSGSTTDEAEIVTAISNGVNFYNYTAHGCDTGFQDPELYGANPLGKDNDVANFGNVGEYPLIVGNCCLTNSFTNNSPYASTYGGDDYCFGENLLKQADGGAIGYIGASMSTYWNEDLAMGVGLDVNSQPTPALSLGDPGLYDGVMELGYSSQGAVKHVGLMAVENYGGTKVDWYWSALHLMGDPSVMIYFGIPTTMTASHDGVIAPGATTYTVTTTPYAYVAMGDQSGVLHGAAQANSSGVAVVPISTYTVGDTGKMVITAQFKQPYYEDVLCTGDTGGDLSINQSSMNFGNVTVGGSSTMQFTISNSHSSEYLMGDITTITGYTVAEAAKNLLTYTVAPQSSKTFDLVFSPVAMTTYSGNIVVTSTDPSNPSDNIAVTGVGALPDINLAATTAATCDLGASVSDSFVIQNTGVAGLNYNLSNAYVGALIPGGNYTENDFSTFPGTGYTNSGWVASSGAARATGSGVTCTLTSPAFDTSGAGNPVYLDFTQTLTYRTGTWAKVEYYTGSAWVQVYYATAATTAAQHIELPITSSSTQVRFTGYTTRSQAQTSYWDIDNLVVSAVEIPYTWLAFNSATAGLVDGSSSNIINLTYDATGLALGDYEANITVDSDDPDEPSELIAVTFTVGGGTIVPAIPSNIVTSISGSNLVVDWDVSADATGYDVYSSDDPYGTFTFAASVGTNQYTIPASAAKLFYYIVATNATK